MTNGTSQGLFVIVAVVIFGIFITLSYVLFDTHMKTGLTDIMQDSFSQAIVKDNNSDGKNTNENDYYFWGFSELTGDNKGMYVQYYEDKENGDMYLNAIFEKVGDEYVQNVNGTKLKGHLDFPDTINGKRVIAMGTNFGTQDGNWTFSQASIESVKLPRYLRTIPKGLFDGATKLEKIVGGLPNNITLIGDGAFTNAPLKGTITIPSGVKTIGTSAFNKSVFSGTLTLPRNLEFIGHQAFITSNFDEVIDNSKVESIKTETIKMSGMTETGAMRYFTK